MKVLLFVAIAIYGAHAALTTDQLETKWSSFKVSHNRNYVNAKEEAFRKQIFSKKIQRIEEHNERFEQGLESYTMGVNQFTDMTPEEMKPWTNGLIQPEVEPKPLYTISSRKDMGIDESVQFPDTFDWRDQGMVTPVKNQGNCGSCWAFSSTSAIESQQRIAAGSDLDTSLSEQQLVDCVLSNDGCNGGWMTNAFKYLALRGGLNSESTYPYEAVQGDCRFNENETVVQLVGYAFLNKPDESMMVDLLVEYGPISVAFDAEGDFGSYSGGVYFNPNCDPTKFTHAVLIVGYGNEDGKDYWLAKNSWGADWGLEGYFKIARNADNHCGIASKTSIPTLA